MIWFLLTWSVIFPTTLDTGIGLQLARNEMSGGIGKEAVVESENLQMQNAIQVNLAFSYVYAYN